MDALHSILVVFDAEIFGLRLYANKILISGRRVRKVYGYSSLSDGTVVGFNIRYMQADQSHWLKLRIKWCFIVSERIKAKYLLYGTVKPG